MTNVMDPPLDELYREVILDHARRPRNRGTLSQPTHNASGLNPVCGDEIELDLAVDAGCIGDIAFRGQGCSISQASCSMLTERLKGRSVIEAHRVTAEVRAMLTGVAEPSDSLGDLEVLAGVAKFPVRVKCALLCWNVLEQGLKQAKQN